MAKNCVCCGKPLGLFAGDNMILENTGNGYCDKCFSQFGQQIRMMKYNDSKHDVEEIYQAFLRDIHSVPLPPDVLPIVLQEAETLYHQRLEACAADGQTSEDEQRRQEEEKLRRARIERLMREMKLTTGHSFEGYRIVEYLDVVSDGVMQGPGFLFDISTDWNDVFGIESNTFAQKMITCRKAALDKLKMQAVLKGANAITGIDFDTMTLPNNMISIFATGTAVVIEKKGAEPDDAHGESANGPR